MLHGNGKMHKIYIILNIILAVIAQPDGGYSSYSGEMEGGEDQRVVGGKVADIKNYRFMVSFVIRKAYVNTHHLNSNRKDTCYCGGTIIRPYWILTAGHCITSWNLKNEPFNKDDAIKKGGYIVRSNTTYCIDGMAAVDRRIVYRKWYSRKEYDIGLVKVDRPFQYLDEGCVKLPPSMQRLPKDNTLAYTVGWGARHYVDRPWQWVNRLKYVQVPILSRNKCLKKSNYQEHEIAQHNICAGKEGSDSCIGDAGGPLLYTSPLKQIRTQIAIVSWGYGCGWQGWPGVYVSTAPFISWINNVMYNKDRNELKRCIKYSY